ncbi:MAG: folylpolyglutamate synthase/dihydrofolate synthase family protein [Thermincola sp.]|jgi:dihydrofolate synthase/folylpolyglutamate synthase|nr:folylpolyglutamate synthase/dihydrofolate synthase family protein [Thermincola sp.]MDT3704382.1 folylpolyglutamate synthase/dihydrofolate synthase family protein [Thermincola sp.]
MNYDEAINFLRDLTKFGFNFGLGRIEELLARLDNPHLKLKVFHVGGTNGKGSTATMIAGVLEAAGFKVGMFTSPHLHSYCERYKINGAEISQEKIAELLTGMRPLLENMVKEGFEHPTEFEVSTALGFLYFWIEAVDFLILEVGLGGAIDSTNVVIPQVSVITNVAMDHMDYLGSTITEIAAIKSGIIKPKVPAVTAADDQAALAVIREAAQKNGSTLTEVGRDLTWRISKNTEAGVEFDVSTPAKTYKELRIRLVGEHQVLNACTALAAIEALGSSGVFIDEQTVRQGLAGASWPARLEMVSTSPRVLLDGAHNMHGALSLSKALKDVFSYQDLFLVFGMLGDKEREKVVAELAPLAKAVVVTKPNSPRAGDWEKIADEVRKYVNEVYLIESIGEAVKKGMDLAGPEDLVCVTGSLYMVAEARAIFKSR